ncbi:MAG TPA: isoprenylcysteine carboxylmethyltransferase family protein [Candidatus Thermoplasmatota archaeon]|nr:isoprenylcysteine carboxylmethyltransferase family protein [Candidatus Thermoplasmatota archaeon]
MDATRRQRTLRAIALMGIGTAAGLVASLDPLRALRTPAFLLMTLGMAAWTVVENLALRQDEPQDYHGKRNTRLLQAGVMIGILVGVLDLFHLPPAHPSWLTASGFAILLAGGAIRVLAIRTLAQHFRYELRVEEGQRLVRTGLYARVRHPSYLGLLLIAVGAPLTLASWIGALVSLAILLPLIALRIRDEERVLEEGFGAEYDRYRGESWRLLPYVY